MKVQRDANIIGPQVRAARRSRWPKLTQVELAEMLCREGVDMDQATLSKIENGERQVFDYEVLALAKVLNVSTAWLFAETISPQSVQPSAPTPPPEVERDLPSLIDSYSPPVRQLFYLGKYQDPRETYSFDRDKDKESWPDYVAQLGLTAEHIPELVRLATRPEALSDLDDPEHSAWLHAWVALAQLGDASVIEPLMADFVARDEDWAIVIEEDIMHIFSLFGARAVEPLGIVFKRYKVESYPTILAIRCLQQIGLDHADAKAACIEVLAEQLKPYRRQDEDYNGCIAEAMLELEALKYEALIREAYKADKLSDFFIGGKESLDRVFKPKKFYRQDGHIALTGPDAVPASRQPRPITAPVTPHSLPVRPATRIPYDLPFDVEPESPDDPGQDRLRQDLWTIVPASRRYDYAPPLDGLLHLRPEAIGVKMKHWPDYRGMGISPQHIPDLIRMGMDRRLFEEDYNSLECWAVPHRWYALGVLQAEAAVQPLINLLRRKKYGDLIYENVPFVLGLIGPSAIPHLEAYLAKGSFTKLGFDRWSVEESLYWIARRHPETRDRCVALLMRQLEHYAQRDVTAVRLLMQHLIRLRAVEALPLLEKAAQRAAAADIEVTGDWFHIQYLMGLLSREEADARRLAYWQQQDLKHYGYPVEHFAFEEDNYQPYTWLDNAPDFDKRGNVDRAMVKTRAARWAYKLTQGWFYGPFAVMALWPPASSKDRSKDSPMAAIAIVDEQGKVLLDSLIQPDGSIPAEVLQAQGLTQEMIAAAPAFVEVYPAIKAALADRSLVIYDEGDRWRLSERCHAHGLDDMHHGYHGVDNEYAYYWGQLNAKRNACIEQRLEDRV